MSSLLQSLKHIRKRTAHNFKFVPDSELANVLTEERVYQELLECKIAPGSLDEARSLVLKF